ncbi:hypothetical protein D3C76_1567310 [compost metagenome]
MEFADQVADQRSKIFQRPERKYQRLLEPEREGLQGIASEPERSADQLGALGRT